MSECAGSSGERAAIGVVLEEPAATVVLSTVRLLQEGLILHWPVAQLHPTFSDNEHLMVVLEQSLKAAVLSTQVVCFFRGDQSDQIAKVNGSAPPPAAVHVGSR